MTAPTRSTPLRWWRFVVIRGKGVPKELDGKWFDLDRTPEHLPGVDAPITMPAGKFVATNMWEQRDDGEVAVVYMPEWTP